MASKIPAKGERVSVPVLTGYRVYQDRPFVCRPSCSCGNCNGRSENFWGYVDDVIYYADNSIEARVICDDGQTRTLRLAAPSGDTC
jgi:hypothetical protein